MDEAVAGGRGRWSTAFGLTIAVLLLSVFDALALVLLPLALLILALPTEHRVRWGVVALLLWAAAVALGGGPLVALSRGWALMIGSTYLAVTLVQPAWAVSARALLTVGVTLAVGLGGLAATRQLASLDEVVKEHFLTVSSLTLGDLQARMPNSPWVAEVSQATERIAALQAEIFPALLGLQSLAALALASWWVRRMRRSESGAFEIAPLREFRFNDNLIWILIAALILLLLPSGEVGRRIALNGLVFMGALYALRGLGIFIFLGRGTRSVPTMVFGGLALLFLYPVALTGALIMGIGDTWLDIRSRVVTES